MDALGAEHRLDDPGGLGPVGGVPRMPERVDEVAEVAEVGEAQGGNDVLGRGEPAGARLSIRRPAGRPPVGVEPVDGLERTICA